MSAIDHLLERSRTNPSRFPGMLPAPPALHVAIVTCMDARIDVYRVFGLDPGQAHVLRNCGGVVTDDVVREIDRRQYADREGPCLDALWEQPTVRMNDSEAEQRWPRFTTEIRDLGIRTMCCFQLFTERDTLGALNLYAGAVDGFPDDAEQVGQLFATHAAVALADAQKIEQLERAVDSRDVIGQAKGILMERYKITADQAFRLLVSASPALTSTSRQ